MRILIVVPALPRLLDVPDSTDLASLLALLGKLEHSQLEFKREPVKLKELIPAFAMTEGGLIVLGLGDDRMLHGCHLDQKAQDTVTRAGKDVGVDVQFKEVDVEGTPLVLVAVPEVRQRTRLRTPIVCFVGLSLRGCWSALARREGRGTACRRR